MSSVTFWAPDTLDGALEILAKGDCPAVLAGGTDLWPHWAAGEPRPEQVLSLHRLADMRQIEMEDGMLRIGATVTHADLVRSEDVNRCCPAAAPAAATIGATQIQNRGPVGGNLVNASPAADLPPPLVAAGAEVVLASQLGARRVALDAFYLGYRKIDLRPDELLVAVLVPPLPASAREHFRKVGTRRAQAISKVMGACRLELDDSGRISRAGVAFGSVAPTVFRALALEQWLLGREPAEQTAMEAEQRASDLVQPIDDLRSSADYRRYIVGRLMRNWILDV